MYSPTPSEDYSNTSNGFNQIPQSPFHMAKKYQRFKYIYILNFEATCIKDIRIRPQEIIEFPCIKLNLWTNQVEAVFHSYVKPVFRPKLSPFCQKLTGIRQSMVDKEPCFSDVFEKFSKWLELENQGGENYAFATSGDWDLDKMFPAQCQLSGVKVPENMQAWINIKRVFEVTSGKKLSKAKNDLSQMLNHFDLEHRGKFHSGIDDIHNMARLISKLCDVTTLKLTSQYMPDNNNNEYYDLFSSAPPNGIQTWSKQHIPNNNHKTGGEMSPPRNTSSPVSSSPVRNRSSPTKHRMSPIYNNNNFSTPAPPIYSPTGNTSFFNFDAQLLRQLA